MFKFVLIAALVASAMSASIPFDLCPIAEGSDEYMPGPVSFAIPECPGIPCDVGVNQTLTMLIGIYVDEAVTALPVAATVAVGEYVFDFPLPTGDACAAIPTGCPQGAGNYLITFPTALSAVDAGTEATVRVQINKPDGRVVACGSVTTTFN